MIDYKKYPWLVPDATGIAYILSDSRRVEILKFLDKYGTICAREIVEFNIIDNLQKVHRHFTMIKEALLIELRYKNNLEKVYILTEKGHKVLNIIKQLEDLYIEKPEPEYNKQEIPDAFNNQFINRKDALGGATHQRYTKTKDIKGFL